MGTGPPGAPPRALSPLCEGILRAKSVLSSRGRHLANFNAGQEFRNDRLLLHSGDKALIGLDTLSVGQIRADYGVKRNLIVLARGLWYLRRSRES